jgi:succinate dehydrogenase / fumarate reductase cytochrome b subunit
VRCNKIDTSSDGRIQTKAKVGMADTLKPRPVYRNIHVTQLPSYRLPPAGWVSILHRISGALLFLLLPFVIWMFDASVSSEVSFEGFTSIFRNGVGVVPGWFFKLVALGLIWGYVQHTLGGLRHLWMDATHAVSQDFGRSSAVVTLILSALLTLALGAKLFF